MSRIEIASHRGGAFLWPENSMTAFRETAKLAGIDQAECDVHLTADGEVVVIHDATLERTTDGRGPVRDRTAAELATIRVKGTNGEPVPSLAQYLEPWRASPILPRVEIKTDGAGQRYPGLVAKTLAGLDAAGLRSRCWIIGFSAADMAEAQAAGGLAGVAFLLEGRTWRDIGIPGALAIARAYGFTELGLPEAVVDAEGVAALHGAGIRLGVWGANHEASIRRMIGLGVDLFATDDPVLALRLRG